MKVEVIYIPEDKSLFKLDLELCVGARVKDALLESKLYELYPETKDYTLGIFSKIVTPETVLKSGDRVEVYRPLGLDPKEKRRIKAKVKK